ncbi:MULTISPECIES: DUF6111 family protein [Xanthobacter]|uniref:Lysylphosphatidylglycerol synthetase-like protein (DUF2156 family) n=1 Tax=Xanthobacter flavus TaxID=281 RepID=A0A9W6CNK5_XANFL|nr:MULTISPECIES: DUF6111 family protein [Xanthobacter]MDR6334806.1 lysylphosphatidylglycerol synthetase-like protein (DUF2156 family) [Xanthobacter flavus]NMN57146.1 lysylphosphatidylglycerol synthetase-like protein (DUF2156 family) [Xanthobacter sp. SG618]UDQ87253.1 DUF6111 family protein [Xanthobacter autotrophicus]UJX44736.1 hypothetical protein D7006_08375 [Xanthobacter sp. YC-JY1]GLI23172.1 hypothetical protein XFLAVUS301_28460 [Xanthobacter flavus]
MARSLLIELALFLTPFLLYGALLIATKGSAVPANWSPRALAITAAAAVALVALGLFFFEHGRVAPPGAHYVPAQTKDGVFVPGHFE